MGLPTARNRGVQASTGEWIAFLDADDWFLPEKLERQRICALEHKNAILIYCGWLNSLDGVASPARFYAPEVLWPKLRYRSAFPPSTVALQREAFEAVGGFDFSVRVCEDWDLWLRLVAHYSPQAFAAVPEPLTVYRVTPGSLSSNAMRMFKAKGGLLEGRCLYDTAGFSKHLWRRRISAFLYYDTSIALREEGSPLDLAFMLKSIAAWPFPWSEMPGRYKMAVVMAKQHLFKRGPRLAVRA
jgi:glycosyltransferase involved in cell wall biosynthesis